MEKPFLLAQTINNELGRRADCGGLCLCSVAARWPEEETNQGGSYELRAQGCTFE